MNQNQKTALIIGGIMLAILVFLILGFGMLGPGMMGGHGVMFLVPLLFIVVLGLVIWAIVAATQKSSISPDTTDHKTETPLDILKRRYAQGEIDKEEYETKKRDLT